jgi:hypothetical protein
MQHLLSLCRSDSPTAAFSSARPFVCYYGTFAVRAYRCLETRLETPRPYFSTSSTFFDLFRAPARKRNFGEMPGTLCSLHLDLFESEYFLLSSSPVLQILSRSRGHPTAANHAEVVVAWGCVSGVVSRKARGTSAGHTEGRTVMRGSVVAACLTPPDVALAARS